MSERSPDARLCHCGEYNAADATECWWCGEPLDEKAPEAADESTDSEDSSSNPYATPAGASRDELSDPHALSSLAMVITLCGFTLMIGFVVPDLGILLAILALGPLVRTYLVVQRVRLRGKQVTLDQRVALWVASAGTFLIASTVCVTTAVLTFLAVCLPFGSEGAIPFATLVAIGVTLFPLKYMFQWIRYRWRRDIGEE